MNNDTGDQDEAGGDIGNRAPVFSQPDELAREIGALGRPLLLVFDCDGVLAPLTDHADDSVLQAGVGAALSSLNATDDVTVAVLSGRSLAGLEQFGFDDALAVAGSYGAERRGRPITPLSPDEADLLARLDELVTAGVELAGTGAWVERKPASVVIHVREADEASGADALRHVTRLQAGFSGHECHPGDQVIELMARTSDKGLGLAGLRDEFSPASVVYIGDDLPDEAAFAQLGDGDLSIKVGGAATVAVRRLPDPTAVRDLILHLDTLTANTRP